MSSARTVLIVTADPVPLVGFRDALRRTGLEVKVVAGDEALSCLRAEQGTWDLLLADVEPGDLSALEAVREYRHLLGRDAPVIALTGEFRRQNIEGMLENLRVRRLLRRDVRPEELTFWVNHELFPDDRRSRRAPRIPARGVQSAAGQEPEEWISNLSEDGLFLETIRCAEVGDELEVEFVLPAEDSRPEHAIRARSSVVWVSPGETGEPRGVGLRFLTLGDADRRAIKSYVYGRVFEESI